MIYTATQIKTAKESASLHGFTQMVSDELAIQYLDWYHANKDKGKTEIETVIRGLTQDFTGSSNIQNQIAWWEEHLC